MSRQRVTVVDADGRRRAAWSDPLDDKPAYGFMEPANPPSTIERRTLTPEELAARQRTPEPSPLARFAMRVSQTAPRPPRVLPEVPAVSIDPEPANEPSSRRTALEQLSAAASEAAGAEAELETARIRAEAAQNALRSAWAAIDGDVPDAPESQPTPPVPQNGVHSAQARMAQSRKNGTDAMLAKRSPKPADPGRARPPWVGKIITAMVAAGGDRKKAAELAGVKYDSLVGSLSAIRKRGDLTDEERTAIAATRKSPARAALPA